MLTTVDRVNDYIGGSSLTATETTVMAALVKAMSAMVETYTGRKFTQQVFTNELHDGPSGDTIQLENFPVISGETFILQSRDSNLNEDDWSTVDSTDYFVRESEGVIQDTGRFLLAKQRYRVTYTAGYDFNNTSTFLADTEAGDVETAVWMLVAELWFKRKGSPDIKSERIGDYAVSYGGSLSGFFRDGSGAAMSTVQAILDQYLDFTSEAPMTPRNT